MKTYWVWIVGMVLLSISPPSESLQKREAQVQSKKCIAEPVDVTSAKVREKLKTAVEITPILSSHTVTRPTRNSKVSTMKYKVTLEDGLQLIMVGHCTGTCSSPHPLGCSVSGCDHQSSGNGCTATVCSGGEDCSASCTKASTF